MASKITTIKLSKKTKDRVEGLRLYKRETYDETLQRMLDILNVCRFNPEAARARLIHTERERRRNFKTSVQPRQSQQRPGQQANSSTAHPASLGSERSIKLK